jgi:hypothetical protein
MSVQMSSAGTILLEDACPSEDAETLLQFLSAHPTAEVDWRACESAHTAVIQVLMASGRKLLGPPAAPRLRDWIAPALTQASAATLPMTPGPSPHDPRPPF